MSNIIKKIVFLLVLAGLLTWGVATMAQGPSVNVTNTNVHVLQGETIENVVELSRDTLHPVGK